MITFFSHKCFVCDNENLKILRDDDIINEKKTLDSFNRLDANLNRYNDKESLYHKQCWGPETFYREPEPGKKI